MASNSYPHPDHNGGSLTPLEHERLVHRQAPDGVLGLPTDAAPVFADGTGTRTVKIRAGTRALVRGKLYEAGPVDIPVELEANTSGSTRTDLVVLRLDRNDGHRVREGYRKGIPGQGVPTLTTDESATVYEFPLSAVTVASGATSLAADKATRKCWYLNDDGLIVVGDGAEYPPHHMGRELWDRNIRKLLVSDGASRWLTVQEDSDFVAVPANVGWGSGTARLRARNGYVTCRVEMTRTGGELAAGTDTNICTIPVGYRPLENVPLVGYNDGAHLMRGFAQTNGLIRLTNYANTLQSGSVVTFHQAIWPY